MIKSQISNLKSQKYIFILVAILIIAAFFRLWQLDSIPPGLYPDVAINGNDTLDSLKTGNFKVFYPENNGREGLMMWLIALSFSIFGVSIWSIKIVAAIIGILTVLGLYLLTKELFTQYAEKCSRHIALLSSFFLATSFWHVNFSRIGFRAILLPFILVFAFYFLFKGFRTQKLYNFIISGIFFGLGFYTYISYRFIIFLLLLILIYFWFIYSQQKLQKKFLFFIFYFLFFIFIIALPIGIYFLQNPQDFIGRAAPISVFAAENPLKEFNKSLFLHLGMFNFYGDQNWRHNFVGSPMLFWPIGMLFLIGFFLSIKEIIDFRKHKNLLSVVNYWSLLSWFFIMLLPGILTFEGIPHALRVIGVIPVVYIFVGFGGWKTYKWFEQNTKSKKLLILTSIVFLIMVGVLEFDKYFVKWAQNFNVEGAFTKRFADIGYYLNSLPDDFQKYVIVNEPGVPIPWPNGLSMPAQTPMFIESTKFGQPQSTYLLPENINQVKIENKGVIMLMRYDQNIFYELQQKFPQGKFQEKDGMWIYQING